MHRKAAYRLGVSIPDELSVVGFDDSPMATRLSPALTTIRMPIRDMGRLAAAKLIPGRVPNEADLAIVTRVTLHLIVRDSSRPPTAGFYNTVGFNDDTRAFLSIPARHDVARRVDCGFLARLVAEHRIDEDEAWKVAEDLAYRLPKAAYRL